MELGFTIEQEALRASFQACIAGEGGAWDRMNPHVSRPGGYDHTTWKKMADAGWLGLTYGKAYGGSGGGYLDLFILFEEMGKALVPSPFFTSAVLGGMLINEFAEPWMKQQWLPSILGGESIVTVALMDRHGKYDYNIPNIMAERHGANEYTITGTRFMVPYAQAADAIIVCASMDDEQGSHVLFIIDGKSKGITRTPLKTLCKDHRYTVDFSQVRVAENRVIGPIGQGHNCIEQVLPRAMALKCAEMAGGVGHLVDTTIKRVAAPTSDRSPGDLSFIEQNCATMLDQALVARLSAYRAASYLDQGLLCGKEISMAKVCCNEAYKTCIRLAHLIHGMLAGLEPSGLQPYFQHYKDCELNYGDSRFHRNIVADSMGIQ